MQAPAGLGLGRQERLFLSVPIRVSGSDISGAAFTEDTLTVNISHKGARFPLKHPLLPEDVLYIKNLESGTEEEFRVLGAFQEIFGERREWGAELLHADREFWGTKFAQSLESSPVRVDLECAACKATLNGALSAIEYDVLLSVGLVSRHCERCGETTRWKPIEPGKPSPAPIPQAEDLRQSRRVNLAMAIRIRNSRGASETVLTRDVSKTGTCFSSSHVYEVGEEIYIARPFSDKNSPNEFKGRVVWSAEGPKGGQYGIAYKPVL